MCVCVCVRLCICACVCVCADKHVTEFLDANFKPRLPLPFCCKLIETEFLEYQSSITNYSTNILAYFK